LDRWFTRSVHSTEAQPRGITRPIGQLRRSVGPQPAFSLSEEPAAREPQPRPPALASFPRRRSDRLRANASPPRWTGRPAPPGGGPPRPSRDATRERASTLPETS